ncbi:DNA recombination protein RmuC [Amaricoccus tamworthensis]|uniref:DNA recombination protein RmuC n=1 Tax=Amaricoccus tamworthensis TaxID=57002 RepID=UPI003C7B85E1
MIPVGDLVIDITDLRLWIAVGLVVFAVVLIRTVGRVAKANEPLARHLADLDGAVRALNDGQNQLHGGITHVAEAQAISQARMAEAMERRLAEAGQALGDNLGKSSLRTARSLGELQQRLRVIDEAQTRIEKLSGDVLGLQDILSNKQTRGAFGEIQLREIVTGALPPDAVSFQATLSNGTRADCLIRMPYPPGPIVIDSKFPLEPYEALGRAETPSEKTAAGRQLRTALRAHIKAISEKYIIEGETSDGALMFLPSEAVYAELHANFSEIVREGFEARVWIVSPTTCMATLHTLRAVLKDTRLRAEAHAIRRELGMLNRDLERLGGRVTSLERHFSQARKDVEEIRVSADRIGRRSKRLEVVDFAEDETRAEPARQAGE